MKQFNLTQSQAESHWQIINHSCNTTSHQETAEAQHTTQRAPPTVYERTGFCIQLKQLSIEVNTKSKFSPFIKSMFLTSLQISSCLLASCLLKNVHVFISFCSFFACLSH